MVDYKEIPESVLLQSNMPMVVQKFRNKALAYKLVKDADMKLESVKGAKSRSRSLPFRQLGRSLY